MKIVKLILAFVFGGAIGFAASSFALDNTNRGLLALSIALFFATFYITCWIVSDKD